MATRKAGRIEARALTFDLVVRSLPSLIKSLAFGVCMNTQHCKLPHDDFTLRFSEVCSLAFYICPYRFGCAAVESYIEISSFGIFDSHNFI